MPLCILLIEDDPDIQKVVKLSLTFQGRHEVLIAAGGLEGIEMAISKKPDLILLDVTMPEPDGYETCRLLKARPDTERIPVIFLSARAQESEVQKGWEAGAEGYLVKPFDPMALSEQINAILRRREE